MGAAELSFVVKAIDEASGTLDHVGGKVGGLRGGLGKLGGLAGGALVTGVGAAVAGIGALGAVLGTSVKEAMAAEEIEAQLKAVLKSTGGVAGVTAEAIQEHALALSEMTRFEDDAIVGADNILLTFTNIGKDVFPDATESVLDLATAFDMDLNSAAMMVGKALNDPEKGLTALNRAGVQFTDTQKTMIKEMVKVGDTAGAQKMILGELEKQVGGSAQAAGSTFAGQMDIFKNALGNVKEEIGGALLPVLTEMMTKFGPSLIEGAKKFADWFVTEGLPALQRVGKWLEENIPKAIAAMKQAWIDAQPTVETIKTIFGNIGDFLAKIWSWLEINVPKAIATLKREWVKAQPAIELIKGVFEGIATALGTVWGWLQEKIPMAIDTIKTAFDALKGGITSVINSIQTAIQNIENAINKLKEFIGMNNAAAGVSGGGGGGAGYNPMSRAPMQGYGGAGTPALAGAWNVTLNINAPGGDARAVAAAAQQGMLSAARSMGLR